MPIDFSNLFNQLKAGVISLAETDLKDYVASATKDGQSILDGMKDNLQTWTQQLSDNEIDEDDFKFNVLGQKGVLEMAALKDAGLAEAAADKFKSDVFNLVITTVFGLL